MFTFTFDKATESGNEGRKFSGLLHHIIFGSQKKWNRVNNGVFNHAIFWGLHFRLFKAFFLPARKEAPPQKKVPSSTVFGDVHAIKRGKKGHGEKKPILSGKVFFASSLEPRRPFAQEVSPSVLKGRPLLARVAGKKESALSRPCERPLNSVDSEGTLWSLAGLPYQFSVVRVLLLTLLHSRTG